jgi:hypothetical protein
VQEILRREACQIVGTGPHHQTGAEDDTAAAQLAL